MHGSSHSEDKKINDEDKIGYAYVYLTMRETDYSYILQREQLAVFLDRQFLLWFHYFTDKKKVMKGRRMGGKSRQKKGKRMGNPFFGLY